MNYRRVSGAAVKSEPHRTDLLFPLESFGSALHSMQLWLHLLIPKIFWVEHASPDFLVYDTVLYRAQIASRDFVFAQRVPSAHYGPTTETETHMPLLSFTPFDPLAFKTSQVNEAALSSLKREIENILSSYVGWYDPFCELIQNSLDAVEARAAYEKSAGTGSSYEPKIDIFIDLDENLLSVTDNGIGLDKEKFEQFLAPNLSFKSGSTRGHKGVGATYVAYGFNYIRVSTRVPGFEASGRILNARSWLKSNSAAAANPKVEPDDSPHVDSAFAENDRGVSVTVRFDETTHPRRLNWIGADKAFTWSKILSIKTGLGSIKEDTTTKVNIQVAAGGQTTSISHIGTKYFWLHDAAAKKTTFRELQKVADALYQKAGPGGKMPDKYSNLDFIFDTWNAEELKVLLGTALDEEELDVLTKYTPSVSVEFGYTAKLWTTFNDSLAGC